MKTFELTSAPARQIYADYIEALKKKSNPIAFLCKEYNLDQNFGYQFADAVLRELQYMHKFDTPRTTAQYMRKVWNFPPHIDVNLHVESMVHGLGYKGDEVLQLLGFFGVVIAHHHNIDDELVKHMVAGR